MATNAELPYSFCKRYGVIAAMSPVSGKLKLTLKNSAPAEAVSEAQRLLGMVDEIEVESDIEFNRLLSQHFENNCDISFTETENIGGELNLDEVARELPEPEDLLESDDDAPIIRGITKRTLFSLYPGLLAGAGLKRDHEILAWVSIRFSINPVAVQDKPCAPENSAK